MKPHMQAGRFFELVASRDRPLIRAWLRDPRPETWLVIRRITVSPAPFMTLAMAVTRLSGYNEERVPDPFTVYAALRHAGAVHEYYLRRITERHD